MIDTYVIVGIQPFPEFFPEMEGLGLVCSSQKHMDQDYSLSTMVL